ncbi:MAG TPA: FkbM family methyltransferase [Tepidiformaceae bacterium]
MIGDQTVLRRLLLRVLPRGVKDRVKRWVRSNVGVDPAGGDAGGIETALRRVDPRITVVFDIGANVGDVTCLMLEMFPKATVFAFEPCSSTFARLRERMMASQYGDRVRLFNHGFYDEECTRALHVTSHHGANSVLEIAPEYHEMNPHIQTKGVEGISLTRLDDFVVEQGINHIDLVKIDVEGAEYEVLSGGERTLRAMVDVVFCELSFVRWPREDGRFIQILQLMHQCGFAPAELYDVAQVDPGKSNAKWRLAQVDCVFRRYGSQV